MIPKLLFDFIHLIFPINYDGVQNVSIFHDDPFYFEILNNKLKIIHTPGHSIGSTTLITESGDCFVGDVSISELSKLNSPKKQQIYVDIDVMESSQNNLLKEKCEWYYPGHGFPFNKDSLSKYLKF
jgi:glyoxylase-like metal-dependent hydrolase (beta-lactamase superfamily II)